MAMESYAIRSTKHKAILVWRFGNSSLGPIPHTIHVWYIYPHLVDFYLQAVNIPYMDGMGTKKTGRKWIISPRFGVKIPKKSLSCHHLVLVGLPDPQKNKPTPFYPFWRT